MYIEITTQDKVREFCKSIERKQDRFKQYGKNISNPCFGRGVLQYCTDRYWTQKQIADFLSCSQPTVSYWLNKFKLKSYGQRRQEYNRWVRKRLKDMRDKRKKKAKLKKDKERKKDNKRKQKVKRKQSASHS